MLLVKLCEIRILKVKFHQGKTMNDKLDDALSERNNIIELIGWWI